MTRLKLFIFGANGQVGQHLVKELAKNDDNIITVFLRLNSQAGKLKQLGASNSIIGDLTDKEAINQVPDDTDVVIFVAGSQGKDVINVDQNAAMSVADVVKDKQISHYILLSSYGADSHSTTEHSLKEYLIAKGKADDYVKKLGIPFTILKPGVLDNHSGTGLISVKKENLEVSNRSIPREDVAKVIAYIAENQLLIGESLELISGNQSIEQGLKSLR